MTTLTKKPTTLSQVWSSSGDKIKPSVEKIQRGWEVEIPLRQHENWLTNRQDQAIAHINQAGVMVWSSDTQYVSGKSYTQGSDGVIYRAKTDNINKDPVSNPSDWGKAFISPDDPNDAKQFVGYTTISSNTTATTNKRYYCSAALTLTLPATAGNGDTITIDKIPTVEVDVKVSGGANIVTNVGGYDTVKYDYPDEVNFVWNSGSWTVQ